MSSIFNIWKSSDRSEVDRRCSASGRQDPDRIGELAAHIDGTDKIMQKLPFPRLSITNSMVYMDRLRVNVDGRIRNDREGIRCASSIFEIGAPFHATSNNFLKVVRLVELRKATASTGSINEFVRTGNVYAMKVYNKRQILEMSRGVSVISHTTEIATLLYLNSPDLVCSQPVDYRSSFPRVKVVAQSNNFIHLIMDNYDKTLSDECEESDDGFILENEAKTIFRKLMQAVAQLHGLNIAHGHIDPLNIGIASAAAGASVPSSGSTSRSSSSSSGDCNESRVFFIDYSSCLRLPEADAAIEGRPRTPGNVQFVAPEIVNSKGVVIAGHPHCYFPVKSDIWSCGAVLYFMLTGVPVCQMPTVADVGFRLICSGGIELCARRYSGVEVSAVASDLLRSMLHKDPQQRISAAEVLQHRWLQI